MPGGRPAKVSGRSRWRCSSSRRQPRLTIPRTSAKRRAKAARQCHSSAAGNFWRAARGWVVAPRQAIKLLSWLGDAEDARRSTPQRARPAMLPMAMRWPHPRPCLPVHIGGPVGPVRGPHVGGAGERPGPRPVLRPARHVRSRERVVLAVPAGAAGVRPQLQRQAGEGADSGGGGMRGRGLGGAAGAGRGWFPLAPFPPQWRPGCIRPAPLSQVGQWAQCGGVPSAGGRDGADGGTCCPGGTSCTRVNEYYYHCAPPGGGAGGGEPGAAATARAESGGAPSGAPAASGPSSCSRQVRPCALAQHGGAAGAGSSPGAAGVRPPPPPLGPAAGWLAPAAARPPPLRQLPRPPARGFQPAPAAPCTRLIVPCAAPPPLFLNMRRLRPGSSAAASTRRRARTRRSRGRAARAAAARASTPGTGSAYPAPAAGAAFRWAAAGRRPRAAAAAPGAAARRCGRPGPRMHACPSAAAGAALPAALGREWWAGGPVAIAAGLTGLCLPTSLYADGDVADLRGAQLWRRGRQLGRERVLPGGRLLPEDQQLALAVRAGVPRGGRRRHLQRWRRQQQRLGDRQRQGQRQRHQQRRQRGGAFAVRQPGEGGATAGPSYSASHPATQPPCHPARRPPSQPATQPPTQPASQPATHQASQPASQPATASHPRRCWLAGGRPQALRYCSPTAKLLPGRPASTPHPPPPLPCCRPACGRSAAASTPGPGAMGPTWAPAAPAAPPAPASTPGTGSASTGAARAGGPWGAATSRHLAPKAVGRWAPAACPGSRPWPHQAPAPRRARRCCASAAAALHCCPCARLLPLTPTPTPTSTTPSRRRAHCGSSAAAAPPPGRAARPTPPSAAPATGRAPSSTSGTGSACRDQARPRARRRPPQSSSPAPAPRSAPACLPPLGALPPGGALAAP
jgi:hypothetical protein